MDATVSCFDTGRCTSEAQQPLFKCKGHEYSVSSVQWYPRDNGLFVTGSFDTTVGVWDANTQKMVSDFDLDSKVYCINMPDRATNHALIVAATEDAEVRLCDLTSGGSAHTLTGHTETLWSVAWSPTAQFTLASGSADGTAKLWDIRRPGALLTLDGSDEDDVYAEAESAHQGGVTCVKFDHSGRYLVTSGADNTVKVWDMLGGGAKIATITDKVENVQRRSCRFAISNTDSLLYLPNNMDVGVYNLTSGKYLHSLQAHFDVINCVLQHPEKQEVYSAGADLNLLAWVPEPKSEEEQLLNVDDWGETMAQD